MNRKYSFHYIFSPLRQYITFETSGIKKKLCLQTEVFFSVMHMFVLQIYLALQMYLHIIECLPIV